MTEFSAPTRGQLAPSDSAAAPSTPEASSGRTGRLANGELRAQVAAYLAMRPTEHLSRATRDRPVWAALVSACLAHDVKISVGGKLHDPHDPDDGFMLDLGAALAVRESAMNSKRICRDVAARAAQGLPHGKIPYGYRRVYDSRTRALIRQEPDPETAPIVQELARRILAGEAFYALTNELNARGVPSPETIRMRRLGNTDRLVAVAPRPGPRRGPVAHVGRASRPPRCRPRRGHRELGAADQRVRSCPPGGEAVRPQPSIMERR